MSEVTFTLEEDLDDDLGEDIIYLSKAEDPYLIFVNLSGAGQVYVNASYRLNESAPRTFSINNQPLTDGTTTYGYVTVSGTQVHNSSLDGSILTVTPYNDGEGYFTVIYEQRGTNYVAGNLQRGDIVRLCYQSPGEISEDALVRLNFIPKIGTPTLTQFVTPDVITTERVYLYP